MPFRLRNDFHALVVGGGLGGLAGALRLRAAGARVTLVEKNAVCGGKAAEIRDQGYRWDVGPSLLTLPDVLADLFAACGTRLEDHLELVRISPVCRYFWPDGATLYEDEAFFRQPEVAAFLNYARGIWELSGEAFLTRPPDELWKAFTPRNWPRLIHLPKVATLATVASSVERRFRDPRLRQLFQRFATYNGSNPFQAPATFNVIPYVEAAFGAWYPRGGMARLPQALETLARGMGVEIRTSTRVTRADERGVQLDSGETLRPDVIVNNGDVIRAHADWIRFPGWQWEAARLARPPRSLSGMVILLGVNHRYAALSHHNIFFSRDYRQEFDELFTRRRPPREATIYLSATARTDPQDAPSGCDNWFILLNAPAETEALDWSREGPAWEERVLDQLEGFGLFDLRRHIVCRHRITPADFAARDLSTQGALYGWASHTPLTALLRPPLASGLCPRLFHAGGTTHPGGGIPLVLLSAKMVTEKILRRFGS